MEILSDTGDGVLCTECFKRQAHVFGDVDMFALRLVKGSVRCRMKHPDHINLIGFPFDGSWFVVVDTHAKKRTKFLFDAFGLPPFQGPYQQRETTSSSLASFSSDLPKTTMSAGSQKKLRKRRQDGHMACWGLYACRIDFSGTCNDTFITNDRERRAEHAQRHQKFSTPQSTAKLNSELETLLRVGLVRVRSTEARGPRFQHPE